MRLTAWRTYDQSQLYWLGVACKLAEAFLHLMHKVRAGYSESLSERKDNAKTRGS